MADTRFNEFYVGFRANEPRQISVSGKIKSCLHSNEFSAEKLTRVSGEDYRDIDGRHRTSLSFLPPCGRTKDLRDPYKTP